MLMLRVIKTKWFFIFYKIKIVSLFCKPLNLLTMWIASKQLHKFSALTVKVSYHPWYNHDVHLTCIDESSRKTCDFCFFFKSIFYSIHLNLDRRLCHVLHMVFDNRILYAGSALVKTIFYAFHILFCPQNFYWK